MKFNFWPLRKARKKRASRPSSRRAKPRGVRSLPHDVLRKHLQAAGERDAVIKTIGEKPIGRKNLDGLSIEELAEERRLSGIELARRAERIIGLISKNTRYSVRSRTIYALNACGINDPKKRAAVHRIEQNFLSAEKTNPSEKVKALDKVLVGKTGEYVEKTLEFLRRTGYTDAPFK